MKGKDTKSVPYFTGLERSSEIPGNLLHLLHNKTRADAFMFRLLVSILASVLQLLAS